jgi:hypothetical protein
MESSRRYFTESCKNITTHATITDGYIPSMFIVDITDEYIRRYFTESSEIFTAHATITDRYIPSMFTVDITVVLLATNNL